MDRVKRRRRSRLAACVQKGRQATGKSTKHIKTRTTILIGLALLAAACAWSGCKSWSPSRCVSPRVEGRVVDTQNHQPIANVEVRRLSSDESYRRMDPPKGGESLKLPVVRTAADGTFVLKSERGIALFRGFAWYSVTVSLDHSSYLGFTTTYTMADATNSATGEPLVKAGDILLIPLAK